MDGFESPCSCLSSSTPARFQGLDTQRDTVSPLRLNARLDVAAIGFNGGLRLRDCDICLVIQFMILVMSESIPKRHLPLKSGLLICS
jgi:hypothetical protein